MPPAGLTAARPRVPPTRPGAPPRAARRRARPRCWSRSWSAAGRCSTLAVGLVAKAAGVDWGAPAQPLVVFLRPALSTWALPAALVLAAALCAALRLHRADAAVAPAAFAAATFGLTLATRLALNVFRGGPGALDQAFVVAPGGRGPHRVPARPPLPRRRRRPLPLQLPRHHRQPPDPGAGPPAGPAADHALPRHRHRPGLAALTIGVGALATPLLYLLGRELPAEAEARAAALLFVFVPTSLLYGATSADALFATLGVLAAVGLLARRPANRVLGAAGLALAAFFSYALLAVGAWAALVRWRREGIGAALRLAAICAAVLVAAYLALDLLTGFDLVAAIRATDARYREGIARLRPYPFWFFGSPAAFVLMLGPVAWFAARSLAAKEATAVALAIVIAISVIAGYTKAETERIWLFLVPFACLAAARSLRARG